MNDNQMKVPAYVRDPKSAEETYIPIEQIEPGSELAHAVIEAEWNAKPAAGSVHEAVKRIRLIATYLKVPFAIP